jgi:hypothetical protein
VSVVRFHEGRGSTATAWFVTTAILEALGSFTGRGIFWPVRVERRNLGKRNLLADRSFNGSKLFELVWSRDGHRATGMSGSARSTNAVDVVFGLIGQVVVDNDADFLDVDSAGGDIGGDEESEFAVLEPFESSSTLGKRTVRVNLSGAVTHIANGFSKFPCAMSGSGKNQS